MELQRREEGIDERGSILHSEAMENPQTNEELKISSFTVESMDVNSVDFICTS